MLYKYMYGVKLDDVKVNGKSTGVCKGVKCLITFDSGTSLMSFPHFAEEIINNQGIPSYDNQVNCDSNTQFGELTFVIGGKEYPLPNEDWMFKEKS